MKLLSFLLGLLILANVVLLAWPQKKESAPHLSQIQDEVNPHFIRLNKEIETRFYSQIREPIEITIDPKSTSPQQISPNQQASKRECVIASVRSLTNQTMNWHRPCYLMPASITSNRVEPVESL